MHLRRTSSVQFMLALMAGLYATDSTSAADPFAKSVVLSRILNGNAGNSHPEPAKALGPSDNIGVSLGGPGASIILDMGETTPVKDGPGPDLEVREIGAAYGGVDESYRVLVSNSADTNTFRPVGVGRALTLMDISSSGLGEARYVWLQDLATETLQTRTPGSDIDSLRALYVEGVDSGVQPPSNVSIHVTGQGVRISWNSATSTNVTGYAIRRSLDGISFGSSPDATLSPQETSWFDSSVPPSVGGYFYSVSALEGAQESKLIVLEVPREDVPLSGRTAVHLGDDLVAAWEDPAADRTLIVQFVLPGRVTGVQAELLMDLWDVDNAGSVILLNGTTVGNVPTQSAESWATRAIRFPSGMLLPGTNTLVFSARTSAGTMAGPLDDFQMRSLALRTFGIESGIITGARFTSLTPGMTNITLRWVVEQARSFPPAAWEPVSSVISWTGTVTLTNGFYRLREE